MSNINKEYINYIIKIFEDNNYDEEKLKKINFYSNPIYLNVMEQLKEFYYN